MASGKIGEDVMMQLCQQVLYGNGIPDEWKTSMVLPIFKGKGDVMTCGSYKRVKLLEHGMKIVERVLERRTQSLVNLDKTQFDLMPGKGTMDTLFLMFMVRRMQEEYRAKEKRMYMYFDDLAKAFDRVTRFIIFIKIIKIYNIKNKIE